MPISPNRSRPRTSSPKYAASSARLASGADSMRLQRKLGLAFALVTLSWLAVATALFYVFRADLSRDEQATLSRILEDRGGLLFVFGLALAALSSVALRFLFRAYVAPAIDRAQGVRII